MRPVGVVALLLTSAGCGAGMGSGAAWMKEPLPGEDPPPPSAVERGSYQPGTRPRSRTLGARPLASERPEVVGAGNVLGTFRNTYYDFPQESDFGGEPVTLSAGTCDPIAKVARGFYDAVCVQGSGSLKDGRTVSFAKRDCPCAEICARTGQRICFEALDRGRFPWGRGAAGRPITPLRTAAADTSVLAMGTVIYLPELDGVSTDGAASDGCFVVEDRGARVQGRHVDLFTGRPSTTAAFNAAVPSNSGVTVIVDSPRCAHLARGS